MATVRDTNIAHLTNTSVEVDSLLNVGPGWNYLTSPFAANTLAYTFDITGIPSQGSAVSAFNASQQAAAAAILAHVGSVTGINFVQVDSAAQADLHFGACDLVGTDLAGLCETVWSLSAATLEDDAELISYSAEAMIYLDIFEFAATNTTLAAGGAGYEVLLHEVGHAMGLKHPFEEPVVLPAGQDNTNNTVMSYTNAGAFKSVFQSYDLQALQWIYGNDGLQATYGLNSSVGPRLGDIAPPLVTNFSPSDEASGVLLASTISIGFNENIARGAGLVLLKTLGGSLVESFDIATDLVRVTVSGNTITIDPTASLAYNTGYRLEIAAGAIRDLAQNDYAGTNSYNFTTQSLRLGADLNSDGTSDLVWRNLASGANTVWRGASSGQVQGLTQVGEPSNWKILGTADFNGDGSSDILWRNVATGANAIWRGGSSANTQSVAPVADLNWKIVGVGDFNGDSSADILWRNSSSGANVIWRSANGAQVQAVSAVGDQTWQVAGIGDFNGDGSSDILWRNKVSGSNIVWRSADVAQSQAVSSVGDLNWQVAGIGDFNGDGVSDILWRNSLTGANVIWRSADSSQAQGVTSVGEPGNWKVAGTGDYNADGVSDILWRNSSTGANAIWNSANNATGQSVSNITDTNWVLQSQTNTWNISSAKAEYDFDGDGKSDLVWRNGDSGANAVWKNASSSNGQVISNVSDTHWKVAGIGDFDGDGKADILWRNTSVGTASTGVNTIWKGGNSASVQAVSSIGDLNWKSAGIGDFDGDGKDDILWRNTGTGANAIWKSANSGTGQAVSSVGDQNWKVAGIGDFDGDGRDDILWRNFQSGSNIIWKSANSATQQAVSSIGDQSWQVAGIGDFNGDGKDDILWRNSGTGANAIWGGGSANSGQAISSVGDLNWQVAGTGDYNGDGKADVLWRNATTGTNTIWSAGNSANTIAVTGVTGSSWSVQDETGSWVNAAGNYEA